MTEVAAIAGQPASIDAAISEAAAILSRSRNAIIAGLGTDIDGAREAIRLARKLGGAIDHRHGGAAMRDLSVMRRSGWIVTTPLQTRARADLVLLVGPVASAWPAFRERLALDSPPALAPVGTRRMISLEGDASELAAQLGILRALIGKRPVREDPRTPSLRAHADALVGCRFGVAMWSAASVEEIVIELLCGLIDELNRTTRFAGLPLDAGDNASGVIGESARQIGFPVRTGFGRGCPEHDPWRFDAVRMVESGEADAAMWVSAISPQPPPWRRELPLVAMVAPSTTFSTPPAVRFTVGRPGVDHDGSLFDPATGALAFARAGSPANVPRTAEILTRIGAAITAPASC